MVFPDRPLETFRSLVSHSSEAMSVVDVHGRIVFENDRAQRLVGWTSGVGRSAFDVVHPHDLARVSEAMSHVIAGGEPEQGLLYRLRHAEGHWITVRASFHFVDDAGGPFAAIHAVDITDYQHVETRLRHAQKLITLGRLTLAMANDFDEGLGSIRQQLVAVLQDCVAEPPRFAVRAIQKAITDATALVSQLRVFAHTAPVFAERVEVNALLRDIRRQLADQVWVSLTPSAMHTEVLIDRNGFREALMDLVLCFGTAMPANSVIAISSTNTASSSTGRPIGPQPVEYIVVEVQNTARCSEPGQEAGLFEPPGGKPASGPVMLALVILHDVVTYAGGLLEVTSNEHAATTVRVFLPVTATAFLG
jgi:PAS domain S-box-containing protein